MGVFAVQNAWVPLDEMHHSLNDLLVSAVLPSWARVVGTAPGEGCLSGPPLSGSLLTGPARKRPDESCSWGLCSCTATSDDFASRNYFKRIAS